MTNESKAALKFYRSGFVNRYHSHPDPTLRNSQDLTDGHSNRMAKLAAFVFPKMIDGNFVLCIVAHDAGEVDSGDAPHHAKNANPALREENKAIEETYLLSVQSLCDPAFRFEWLSPEQEKAIKILDLLESFLYQCFVTPYRMEQEGALVDNIMERLEDFGEEEQDKIDGLILEGLAHADNMGFPVSWFDDDLH